MKWQSKKDFKHLSKHQNLAQNAVISTSNVEVSHARLEVIIVSIIRCSDFSEQSIHQNESSSVVK